MIGPITAVTPNVIPVKPVIPVTPINSQNRIPKFDEIHKSTLESKLKQPNIVFGNDTITVSTPRQVNLPSKGKNPAVAVNFGFEANNPDNKPQKKGTDILPAVNQFWGNTPTVTRKPAPVPRQNPPKKVGLFNKLFS